MPELPEVETIKRGLLRGVLNKKIARAHSFGGRSIKNPSRVFSGALSGCRFTDIERKGKLLAFKIGLGENYMLAHMGMTGQLIYKKSGEEEKHLRAVIEFANGGALYFHDIRKFGYLKIVGRKEKEKKFSELGPDALLPDFTEKDLKNIFKNSRASVKSLLMNQKKIAGIGNIYADEILFDAGILPQRKGGSLIGAEIKKLFSSLKKILKQAIVHRGTTISDFVDVSGEGGMFAGNLKVYQKEGELCPRCHRAKIQKITLAGRGTHFCPRCQK